jgi:hypothetical protein
MTDWVRLGVLTSTNHIHAFRRELLGVLRLS